MIRALELTKKQQAEQINEMTLQIDGLERERSQWLIEGDRFRNDALLFEEKLRTLEETLRIRTGEVDTA